MNSRNRRRNRQANMKARLGLAGAVLVGGGAVGVAAVAANGGGASTTTSAAAYIMGVQHHIPASQALSGALSTWGKTTASHQRALGMLAQMNPMRNFNQVWGPRHTRFAHTQYAAQRGVVTAIGTVANRQFLVVRSANGQMKVWWLTGKTGFVNAAGNAAAMVAMTGNNNAALQAAANKNMMPATNTMAGNMAVANKAAAGGFSFTGTFTINGQTFTITINATTGTGTVTPTTMPPATGTVTAPATGMGTTTATAPATGMGTTTATAPATGMGTTSMTPTAPATMPVTLKTLVKGDLVFVAGVRSHGQLSAQLVILLKVATAAPNPGASGGQTTTITPSTPPASNGAHL
jgi:hypothetical protein